MAGKLLIVDGGKAGILSGGDGAVTDSNGDCAECCGITNCNDDFDTNTGCSSHHVTITIAGVADAECSASVLNGAYVISNGQFWQYLEELPGPLCEVPCDVNFFFNIPVLWDSFRITAQVACNGGVLYARGTVLLAFGPLNNYIYSTTYGFGGNQLSPDHYIEVPTPYDCDTLDITMPLVVTSNPEEPCKVVGGTLTDLFLDMSNATMRLQLSPAP